MVQHIRDLSPKGSLRKQISEGVHFSKLFQEGTLTLLCQWLVSAYLKFQNVLFGGWVGGWMGCDILPPSNFLYFQVCYQALCACYKYGVKTYQLLLDKKL